jgi:argininosuccinate synthase
MRVVLAYSGGLDTTFALRFLQDHYNAEVVTVLCNVGQEEDLSIARTRSEELGGTEHHEIDCRDELARDYLWRAVKANAAYEGTYYLHSALHRPLIVEKVVEIAKRVGADAVAHGNTGMGNDQFRYDICFRAFGPEFDVLAPVRDHRFTRAAEMEYLEERGIPLPRPKDRPYSVDANLWGYFCGEFPGADEPDVPTPREVFSRVRRDNITTEPRTLRIGFENGEPVALDGEQLDPVELITRVDQIAGAYGYGWIDYVESSVYGTKLRQIVESPAAMTLIAAHQDLERLVLTRRELSFKRIAEQRWAEVVFEGLWIDPLRETLDALFEASQQRVTGEVTLELSPGAVHPIARQSPHSLYDPSLYSYGTASQWDQDKGAAFSELWGMASVAAYRRNAVVGSAA